ncbi:BUD13-like [Oopsacas minuta]|uniref:BUD13 homolog n=1 Tax=Oopsacas minuta TaxID=111878 RepID=A0AAV7JYM0_9METZ|nr:BUD13-like [Oopsacas minuta]
MASKLDYLKKYLSKSDEKQLHSQIEKGEKIKIKKSTNFKRRKKVSQTGIIILNPEKEATQVRDSQSSESSDSDGPTVVESKVHSREAMKRLWNPINTDTVTLSSVRTRYDSDEGLPPSRQRHDSDSDIEVTRDKSKSSVINSESSQKNQIDSDSDIEVTRKSTETRQHKQESKRDRKSRWSRDEKMTSDNLSCAVLLQANDTNQTVYRDKHGHKIDLQKELELKAGLDKAKLERDAEFKLMKSGIVQAKLKQEKVEDFKKESKKGLNRYKGDESMNELLKAKQLIDDPLLKMKRKKVKKNRPKKRCKPTYQEHFPSNRFNIRPGYRWDGVDRSNGYEKERFRIINDRKADNDDYYKLGNEDL